MGKNILVGLGILILVAIVILGGTLFTVNQAQQALVLRFGSPIREIRDPGLHVKVPFLDQVQCSTSTRRRSS
jgi:membrane protease subunit HflC